MPGVGRLPVGCVCVGMKSRGGGAIYGMGEDLGALFAGDSLCVDPGAEDPLGGASPCEDGDCPGSAEESWLPASVSACEAAFMAVASAPFGAFVSLGAFSGVLVGGALVCVELLCCESLCVLVCSFVCVEDSSGLLLGALPSVCDPDVSGALCVPLPFAAAALCAADPLLPCDAAIDVSEIACDTTAAVDTKGADPERVPTSIPISFITESGPLNMAIVNPTRRKKTAHQFLTESSTQAVSWMYMSREKMIIISDR